MRKLRTRIKPAPPLAFTRARRYFTAVAGLLACSLLAYGQGGPVLYTNPQLPIEKRVEDLVSRLTLEEKVSQLMSDAEPVDRLGIPRYNWWNESLHGVGRAGRATVFPQAIAMAAAFDSDLVYRVANAISDEARAKHHDFVRRQKRGIYQGLTYWTPNINIFRDPRWGRGMETYGEDPYLTARTAVQFIKGLQGSHPKYLKLIATAKHFAVHSGPEQDRHTFDARASRKDLVETYLPQFEAAVKEGGAKSIMCAYNRYDGVPACASKPLLEDLLRTKWKFDGYVVSDCAAILDIHQNHKAASSAEQAAAMAVKSGTDLNCGVEYSALVPAVKQKLISEADINSALRRVLTARFRLGMFDPPSHVPFAQIPLSSVDSPAHRLLALEAARKSIVLLKNDNNVLPLRKDLKNVVVLGPNANNVQALLGNYHGDPSEPMTALEGIRRKVSLQTKVNFAQGSDLARGLPTLDVIPSNVLFTSKDADKKNGLNAEYYKTSNFNGQAYRFRELAYPNSGQMVGDIPVDPKPLFTRIDTQVDFKWWDKAPRPDMDDDNFGVRWTGYLLAPVTGMYQVGAYGQTAFELYLDGKQLVKYNNIHERAYEYETVELQAGKYYPIRLDYHHTVNDADIKLLWAPPDKNYDQLALDLAKDADAVIMALGLSPRLEGEEMRVPVEGFEGGDRSEIGLPKVQEELLDKVLALGKPVVLVLFNGSSLAVEQAKNKVPAIIEAWYPGQAGGAAIADVIFGDYNPAGRLPVTFYQSSIQLPPFDDYSMKGRTYRYFQGKPLFPFGHGLSYTTFNYNNFVLPSSVPINTDLKFTVEIENSGKREGEEVVQLYVRHVNSPIPGPIRSLQGYQRVLLRAGERRRLEFTLTPAQLAQVTEEGQRVLLPGTIELSVGGKQPGFSGLADSPTTEVVTRSFTLSGEEVKLD